MPRRQKPNRLGTVALKVLLGSALVTFHHRTIWSPGVLLAPKASATGLRGFALAATLASEEQVTGVQFALRQEAIHRSLGFPLPGVESGLPSALALASYESPYSPGWLVHQASPLGLGALVLPKYLLRGFLDISTIRWQVVRRFAQGAHSVSVSAIL